MKLAAMVLTIAAAATVQAGAASAKPSAQSMHCSEAAKQQGLAGSQRTSFVKSCLKGPLAATKPTAPTASSQEAQAVTKPSGVDRTTRTKQCAAEADRKGLSEKDRKSFQLSCLATAGPVTEGETGKSEPQPAKQIKGIGVNNYKPNAAPAKSTQDANPPAAAKPHG